MTPNANLINSERSWKFDAHSRQWVRSMNHLMLISRPIQPRLRPAS